MPKAIWNGRVIAESDKYETAEGNVYFLPETVKREYLAHSSHTTRCQWKGQAHYYHVVVDGKENKDAAWYYPDPTPDARNIRDHVAFWNGVEVHR